MTARKIDDNIIECEGWTRHLPRPRASIPTLFGTITVLAALPTSRIPTKTAFKIVNDYTGDGWNDQVDVMRWVILTI